MAGCSLLDQQLVRLTVGSALVITDARDAGQLWKNYIAGASRLPGKAIRPACMETEELCKAPQGTSYGRRPLCWTPLDCRPTSSMCMSPVQVEIDLPSTRKPSSRPVSSRILGTLPSPRARVPSRCGTSTIHDLAPGADRDTDFRILG
ncbi:hypothetical protein BDV96DRAFT_607092 [Lophiotrema nucula]|uniref:Uncharacterized protein n=1 Tax=Lophiotrema nucula TaxID=690887 RepID=A0A6A5YHV5_9PLEO|nr:hypothetical protein BDV96DRAFT_607092 [Lophiotrema nucula]